MNTPAIQDHYRCTTCSAVRWQCWLDHHNESIVGGREIEVPTCADRWVFGMRKQSRVSPVWKECVYTWSIILCIWCVWCLAHLSGELRKSVSALLGCVEDEIQFCYRKKAIHDLVRPA